MENKDKWEQRAKMWDERLPNLAKALRSEDLQKSCSDIDEFWGWIRDSTSKPKKDERVLVTNGKNVWIGEHDGKEWSVVFDGAPPFDSTQIIAWMFMPSIPDELTKPSQP